MTKRGRHLYTEEEAAAVYRALTSEEKDEYNRLVLGSAFEEFPANTARIRELTNRGFARIRKDEDDV